MDMILIADRFEASVTSDGDRFTIIDRMTGHSYLGQDPLALHLDIIKAELLPPQISLELELRLKQMMRVIPPCERKK